MLKVLLLEDSAADVMLFREALHTRGTPVELTVADRAERGLELLRSNACNPGLIVLDLNLPGMSGHDFIEEYGSQLERVRIVVLSGSQNTSDREKALKSGVYEFVTKPSGLREYIRTVQGIVKRATEG